MQKISAPYALLQLFDAAATREKEQLLAGTAAPHALMQRAGLATARLALGLAPHARTIWIVCGPGNNGGDGFEAAACLQEMCGSHKKIVVSWMGTESSCPPDAAMSLERLKKVGLQVLHSPEAPALDARDICIDALLGIGAHTPSTQDTGKVSKHAEMMLWIAAVNKARAPVLSIDVPSGLNASTGQSIFGFDAAVRATNTLTLLALKPGLFTARGRDLSGVVWLDKLRGDPSKDDEETTAIAPSALLNATPEIRLRPHDSHKGTFGDVAVIGGAEGMRGAAILCASAALHAGAGRVYLSFVGTHPSGQSVPAHEELMIRHPESLDLRSATTVIGCGGGDSVKKHLAKALSLSPRLVIDADALNAIAKDSSLQALLVARSSRRYQTVMTPHPLEAARLLNSDAKAIQADRLVSAQTLARQFRCAVVLKGSGSIIAHPDKVTVINATGNARLATAGTGDVLAGMIGARLSSSDDAWIAACEMVYRHGELADLWPANVPLTASALAMQRSAGAAF